MAKPGELQNRVQCMACGRQFLVDSPSMKVPKHPPKGEQEIPHVPYIPCIGSNTVGILIGSEVKGFD